MFVMSEHIKKEHNKTLLLFHLVCPARYRRDVFSSEVNTTLKDICREIEQCHEIYYVEIGTDINHVHFLIQTAPTMMSSFVQITKSITARNKRQTESAICPTQSSRITTAITEEITIYSIPYEATKRSTKKYTN